MRPHVAAIYAFARAADDFADEEKYRGRSLELLEAWRTALRAIPPGGDSALTPLKSPSLDQTGRKETLDVAHEKEVAPRNNACHDQCRDKEWGGFPCFNHVCSLLLKQALFLY